MRGRRDSERGVSILELLISMALLLAVMVGITALLIQNARANRSQQLVAELQTNARTCVSMIVQRLRNAGWDPMNASIGSLTLDPNDIDGNDADGVDEIEIFADFDEDGATTSADEQVFFRRIGDEIQMRDTASGSFSVLAVNITNDADGDGTPEPMFVVDSVSDPTRVTVTITARSSVPDPVTGEYLRYTIDSDVALRTSN